MVRIFIKHDLVTAPIPAVAIRQVVRGDSKIKSAKEEPIRAATIKTPHMPRAEPTVEMPIFPRMVEMIVFIVGSGVMSNPVPIIMNMRSIRVTRSVLEVPIHLHFRRAMKWFGTVSWSRRRTSTVASATMLLRLCREQKNKHYCKQADNSLHETLPGRYRFDHRNLFEMTVLIKKLVYPLGRHGSSNPS
jgi:hypothetical protein